MVSLFRSIWLMRLIQAFVNCSRLGSLPLWRNTLLQVFSCLSFIQSTSYIYLCSLGCTFSCIAWNNANDQKNNSLQQRPRFRSVYGKFSIPLLSVTRLSFQRCSRAESPQHLWIPHRSGGRPGRSGSSAVPAGTGSGALPAVRWSTGNRQRSPESKTLVLQISKSL